MPRLIQLLYKFGGLFLFLVLESLALFFVVQYNKERKAIFFNSLSVVSGMGEDVVNAITTHFSLNEVVDSLLKENTRYKEMLINVGQEYTDKDISVFDSEPLQQYILLESKILKNSIRENHNYLILDKGSEDGVEEHSAVISDNGIVGIVIKTRKKHSLVMSILHRESRISAAILGKNAHGSLVWEKWNPKKMYLEDIPKHIQAGEKDTIITSGYSALFPAGLIIGTVDSVFLESGSNFYTIPVILSNDLSTLKYVYIVTNLMKAEHLILEQEITDE
ncbi:MAG: rod shape-determining protein MreC [Calditrichia bacterium]